MVKFATLYMYLTPLFGVSIVVIALLIYFTVEYYNNINCQVEGMEDEDPLTTEQAYLVNNILAKIAVDDPELSNVFSISIIRSLGITNPSFVTILDRDVSVTQKLKELAGKCLVNRPALPPGFTYATIPSNLSQNSSNKKKRKNKKRK